MIDNPSLATVPTKIGVCIAIASATRKQIWDDARHGTASSKQPVCKKVLDKKNAIWN